MTPGWSPGQLGIAPAEPLPSEVRGGSQKQLALGNERLQGVSGAAFESCSCPSAAGTGGAAQQQREAGCGVCECAKRPGQGLPFVTGSPTTAQIKNASVLAGCAGMGERDQRAARTAQGSCRLDLSHRRVRGGGHTTQPGLGFVSLSLSSSVILNILKNKFWN